jgi:asparagine synthase (glutamine-hydrolysing)
MCGIFGVALRNTAELPDAKRMAASTAALAHRGPDGNGIHVEAGIGLAHTRLSLLDLSERGRQPFWDPEGRYCLVYNGEVYNFRELRQELEAQGVVFRSGTDTEVVLHSLIRWGAEDALGRLCGMFALALYDRAQRQLLLARDRFGIKPLCVYEDDRALVFASEIKAMRPWVELEGDPFPISAYLLGFGGPTRDRCFYRGVRIVPPGSIVRLELGGAARFSSFTTLPDLIDVEQEEELRALEPRQVVDRLDELLQDSVRRMLFADAPVGALCSGGVDSSLIMALAARQHSNLAIFHADVVGPVSEYEAARALAEHLKLDLRTVAVHDQDFLDGIPEVTHHYDHPFVYHPNSVPFLAVAKLVRESRVKAVLSGEGADECFLGYQPIAQEPVVRFMGRQAARLRRLAESIPGVGKLLGESIGEDLVPVTGMLSRFERELERTAFEKEYVERRRKRLDWNVRTLLWLGYHLRTTLHRNDCLGMAAGIEARFPILDERITKFAVNLPHPYKIRFSPGTWEKAHPFFRDKWVLRMVADRYIPKQLSRRKKMGFHVTAFERMKIGVDSIGSDGFVARFFELDRSRLEALVAGASQRLRVRLLLLEVWGRVCLGSEDVALASEDLRRHVSVERERGARSSSA